MEHHRAGSDASGPLDVRSSLRESPVLSGPLADFLWIWLYPVHVGRSLARSQKRAPVRSSKPLSGRAVWEQKKAGQKLSLEINSILHPPSRDVEATTQSDDDFLKILFKLSRLNFSVIILHVGAVMSAEPSCGIPTIISGASESADQGDQKRSAAD